jgi:hypothetical protein
MRDRKPFKRATDSQRLAEGRKYETPGSSAGERYPRSQWSLTQTSEGFQWSKINRRTF